MTKTSLIIVIILSLVAVVTAVIILIVHVFRSKRAPGHISISGGADADSGRLGTGNQDFAKKPYDTVVTSAVPNGSIIPMCQVVFQGNSGNQFSFAFRDRLVLGRGTPGVSQYGIGGIGELQFISRQQLELWLNGDNLFISNASNHVIPALNGIPLTQPKVFLPGSTVSIGALRLTLVQAGQFYQNR